ncbi:MAG: PKD domain-containing protein, partial [Desulfobacterales bacterium]
VNLAGILIDPSDPVPVNTEISAEAGFTGVLSGTNAYSAIWDWGDGKTSDGTINKDNGIVTGSHVYTEPGVYSVSLEVNEVNEGSGLTGLLKTAVYQYVVVYDPEAGFVTGGGWFDSPAGAYKDNIESFGQATFGFVSRYKKGADVPTGNTAFEFAAGGLYFHSTSYDWLVVTGSDYAKFKGSGTINGLGDFKFMVWAGDGAPDTFRIRIWDELEDTGKEIDIYDNESDQAIGAGSIVIHVK